MRVAQKLTIPPRYPWILRQFAPNVPRAPRRGTGSQMLIELMRGHRRHCFNFKTIKRNAATANTQMPVKRRAACGHKRQNTQRHNTKCWHSENQGQHNVKNAFRVPIIAAPAQNCTLFDIISVRTHAPIHIIASLTNSKIGERCALTPNQTRD